MNDSNILTLALTKIEQDTIKDIATAASAREALRWTQELDSSSFQKFILQLSRTAGQVYDWQTPARKAGEDDRSYNIRLEANFMELSGSTLSNLIGNCKSWVGVWAGIVLDKGLTLIPEFNADDKTSDLARPLDNWFDRCGLKRYLSPDAYSRMRSYLLEVHPHLRLYSDKLDAIVKPLLVDEDAGFGIAYKIRIAVDAVRRDHENHGGKKVGISHDLGVALAESFEQGGKYPGKLAEKVFELGCAPEWAKKHHTPVQVGSWLLGSDETGDKRIEYLIVANSPDAITFLESTFGRAPFVLRSDMGGDSDSRRRKYKGELDQDQGDPVGVR